MVEFQPSKHTQIIMEKPQQHKVVFRKPNLNDGQAIYELVKKCPPLDLNSRYLYFLQADHFADTCVLAELNGKVVGFISGYIRPDEPHNIFVWQVAVALYNRGKNIAKDLTRSLIENQGHRARVDTLSTTIGPSNTASQKLFCRFAKSYDLEIRQENYLDADQFGEDAHEAELIYTLTAPKGQTLIESINLKE